MKFNTKEKIFIAITILGVIYNFTAVSPAYGIGSVIGAGVAGLLGMNFTKNRKETALATGLAFGFVGLAVLLIANRISPPNKEN